MKEKLVVQLTDYIFYRYDGTLYNRETECAVDFTSSLYDKPVFELLLENKGIRLENTTIYDKTHPDYEAYPNRFCRNQIASIRKKLNSLESGAGAKLIRNGIHSYCLITDITRRYSESMLRKISSEITRVLCHENGSIKKVIPPAEISIYDDPASQYQIIYFGKYPQHINQEKEPIEWLIIDEDDDCMLLLSKYVIDAMPFDHRSMIVSWKESEIRRWLNNEFLSSFSNEEKARIITNEVRCDNNPVFLVDGGEDTQDKVFLLSIDEVYSCFYTDYYRRCVATAYAKEHEKAYQSSTEDYTVWWLRDPGMDKKHVTLVYTGGNVSFEGWYADTPAGGIRPAILVRK